MPVADRSLRTRGCNTAPVWDASSPVRRGSVPERVYLASMGTIELRARLFGGDHTDLTHENPDLVDENAIVNQVIEVLSADTGVLRCRHGQRLVALFARGVASIEISPRGAVL